MNVMPSPVKAPPGSRTGFLVAEAGGLRQVFGLIQENTQIGRTSRNDIRLPFTAVSRAHALVVRTPMGYKIVDNQSKNGVFVNDVRVIEKFLEEGDRIRIGEVNLGFTYRDPTGEDPSQKSETGSMLVMRAAPHSADPAGAATAPSVRMTRRHETPVRSTVAAAPLVTALLAAVASGAVVALLMRVSPASSTSPTPDADAIREQVRNAVRLEVAEVQRRQSDKIENLVSFHRDENEKLRLENDRLNSDMGKMTTRIAELTARIAALHTRLTQLATREPKEEPSTPGSARPTPEEETPPPPPFGQDLPQTPTPVPIPPPMPPPPPPDPDDPPRE